MKIGILGSGLVGLSAALQLADTFEVVIFEKNDNPGGCMSSLTLAPYNNTYTI